MPDTPPNPDALASAVSGYQYRVHCARGAEHCPACQGVVEAIIHDYLAAAQPEVNSVEELDALPDGAYVQGYDGYKHAKNDEGTWNIVVNHRATPHGSDSIELPARVLYRPEVKP